MKLGFLVNPVAGMGGRVGLKGTDGMVEEALKRGAEPVAADRARECVEVLKAGKNKLDILTCSGAMGADVLKGMEYEAVYGPGGELSADDTIRACRKFVESDAELILFCGGDGTARDVYSEVDSKVPVLGVPAGVKMHSSVFAVNPHAAGELALDYASGEAGLHDAEVVDVDEEAYRGNELKTRLYGIMQTPYKPQMVQASKMTFQSTGDEEAKEGIAEFAAEFMSDGSAYMVGAGSTTKAVGDRLGVDKTLLGVDVIKNGEVLMKDVGERELLQLLDSEENVKVIVSPIGAQGFVFGRGTQQISPEVLRRVGVGNIIYVSTPNKLNRTPYLLVDTGDRELDRELAGYRRVVMGYRMAQRKDVKAID